ncbi:ricin-type beta-trefoil lectin domain protein [Streptomyces sp. NBC_01537]|uniref:glycoside hydrolase n=1 Tax=Streptomyces sp. NBC_01537 TaxID=2903896 RepID=UPI0038679E52
MAVRTRTRALRTLIASAAAALSLTAPTAPAHAADDPAAAQVSPHAAQTIDNIGASGAWWVNDLAGFAPKQKAKVAELLFGSHGLDLSSYRYNIGGGGTAVTTPARAAQDFLNDDGTYDWTKDPGGREFAAYAARYGVEDLIGFVNSAPSQLKTNGQSCGGSLISGDEGAYATYIADVAGHFRKQGVKFDYISPFNEPTNSFDSCGQEGMLVDVSQRDDIVRALGAELASRGAKTGIIADESSSTTGFNTQIPQWLGQDGTAQYVSRLAHHTYNNPGDGSLAQILETSKAYGKQPWATEICCFGKGSTGWNQEYDPTIDNALLMSRIVYKDFATAHDSAFQWWVALASGYGSDPYTRNDEGWNDGLVYYDPDYAANGNQTLYMTKRYYALGQYSKFVRPGAVLHNVTGAPSGVEVTAYDHKGTWTLVVNNHNAAETPLSLRFNSKADISATRAVRTSATEDWAKVTPASVSGSTVSATLAPRSVTTYVFRQHKHSAPPAALTGALVNTNSAKCLTADGTITACAGTASQTWTYDASGRLTDGDGACLATASTANGARATTAACASGTGADTAAQRWQTNANGQIVNEETGKCLDVSGWGTADGTPVILWTCGGGTNQAWTRSAST